MVASDCEAHESDGIHGELQRQAPRQPLAEIVREQRVHKAEARDHDNVDLWMAKESKQVLKQDGVPAAGEVKNRGVKVPV